MIPVTYLPRPKLAFKCVNSVIGITIEPQPGINLSASKTIVVINQDAVEPYRHQFVNTSSFTVLAAVHGIENVKGVTVLDEQQKEMLVDTTINQTNQDITVTIGINQTGTIIIY